MILVFTGIQWSWKWTQARILSEKYWFTLLEMWGELRKIIDSWSELWNSIKAIIEEWHLLSPEIVWNVMKEVIESQNNDKLILDWFVRNLWNKQSLEKIIPDYKVVFFNLSKDKAIDRLLWRVIDPETWETFPSWTEVNPKNGNKLIKRSDDTEQWILTRINAFVEQTLPIVDMDKEEWRVIELDADQKVEDVFKELEEKLNLN